MLTDQSPTTLEELQKWLSFQKKFAMLQTLLMQLVTPPKQIWLDGNLADAVASPLLDTCSSQKSWTAAVDEVTSAWSESSVSCRLETLKKLQSGAHSGAWVTCLPVERYSISGFSPSEWQVLL